MDHFVYWRKLRATESEPCALVHTDGFGAPTTPGSHEENGPKGDFASLGLPSSNHANERVTNPAWQVGYGVGVQEPTPLREPVQVDPPPPVAPPIRKSFHGWLLMLTPSGVPTGSEFPLYAAEQVVVPLPPGIEGFVQVWLETLLSSVGLAPTSWYSVPVSPPATQCD